MAKPAPVCEWEQGALFAESYVWDKLDEVRRVNVDTARSWIERWHYSHTMPGGGTSCWGLFRGDMVALCTISEPTNPYGLAPRYSLQAWNGNKELSRLVVHPDAPKMTASTAVAAFMRTWHVELGFDWLFSYADTGQGHHGGVYQAVNSVYVGMTGSMHYWLLNGVEWHNRSINAKYGTGVREDLIEIAKRNGDELIYVADGATPKHTYILLCGTPATRRAIRKHLEPFAKPYPKRGPDLASEVHLIKPKKRKG